MAAVPALQLEEVTRSFGRLQAVDGVSLRVEAGERRAIIGPNGAGKTTLFNLITGELPLTRGRIFLFAQELTHLPVEARIAQGLGRTYQVTNLFPQLTVEQNLLLAALGLTRTKFRMLAGLPRSGPVREQVERLLAEVRLEYARQRPARELSHGEQRQLEVAMALASRPRVLLLDEPAAGLSAAERVMMGSLIRALPRDLTVVFIEHDMDLALGLADRVTCLHYGQIIAEDTPDRIRTNAQVQRVYLGVG
ncbi:MAG: ABC transporter ATP-binding protein [Candidatus Tectimicrobiota bacterium]|nr:MAG: ABC transporter ATP-binding protein [Candidatus Tectomicrobia bacterium]